MKSLLLMRASLLAGDSSDLRAIDKENIVTSAAEAEWNNRHHCVRADT